MTSPRSSTSLFASAPLLLALFTSTTAHAADPADLDAFGPIGRSSIAVSGGYDRGQYDSAGGKSRSNTRSLWLAGIYAVHERVDIEASVFRSLFRSSYESSYGSYNYSDAGTSQSVGVSVRAVGTPTGQGFGLVGGLTLFHSEGVSNSYFARLMPQYRFDDRWLAALSMGVIRDRDDFRGTHAAAVLLWKARPDLSLVPSLTWNHVDSRGSYPSQSTWTLGFDASYYLSAQLALRSGLSIDRVSDQGNTSNRRSGGVSLGLRWVF